MRAVEENKQTREHIQDDDNKERRNVPQLLASSGCTLGVVEVRYQTKT